MKKLLLNTFLIAITISITLSGELKYKNSPYFSALVGSYKSGNASSYNGSSSLSFGAGFGIPIYGNLSLYAKATYYSKSNFSAVGNQNYLTPGLSTGNDLISVNASFSQFIMNGGLQYNIPLSKNLFIGINGGITYSIVNQELSSFIGTKLLSLDNQSVHGYFGGISAEKEFEDSDFSLLGEIQYLYFNDDVVNFSKELSGMNLAIGMRYYFTR